MSQRNGTTHGDALGRLQALRDRTREAERAGGRAGPPADVAPLGDLVARVAEGASRSLTVSDRLKRKFGLGERPARRMALYLRLEGLAAKHGDKVLAIISTAVAQSVSADDPGRYFCFVVVRMLRDSGLMGGDHSW